MAENLSLRLLLALTMMTAVAHALPRVVSSRVLSGAPSLPSGHLPFKTDSSCESWIDAKTTELGISVTELAQKIVSGSPRRIVLEFMVNCLSKEKAIAPALIEKSKVALGTKITPNNPAARANKATGQIVQVNDEIVKN